MAEKKSASSIDDILLGDFDPLGLLTGVMAAPKKVVAKTPIELRFQEINTFYEKTQRVPVLEADDLMESQLAARLASYRARPDLRKQVEPLDVHGLLVEKKEEVADASGPSAGSIDDILNGDAFGLLDGVNASILKIENVTNQAPEFRNWPDEIASRKPCEDFFKYEKLFKDMTMDILNRKVETARFKNGSQVEVGDFFIVCGLVCLVDCILEESRETSERDNPRVRVIFENGVESNLLKLSLARALYKDPHGRRIIPDADTITDRMTGVTHKDKATGCIYILASETKAPELASLKMQGRLVKIGYSTQSVEERVKNAENDPTYLEAPVRILASLDCYNLNPQKVEHLIHAFLAKQRISMRLVSSKGTVYTPTEWFSVDRDTAIAVAEHIVNGDIMNYRMDNTTGRIVKVS